MPDVGDPAECWEKCVTQFGAAIVAVHYYPVDGACWCQDDCGCLADTGDSTSFLLTPIELPEKCGCIDSFIGDLWCDPQNNNEECTYDGGDCCENTCFDYTNATNYCGIDGYNCLDPAATASATPTLMPTPMPSPLPSAM